MNGGLIALRTAPGSKWGAEDFTWEGEVVQFKDHCLIETTNAKPWCVALVANANAHKKLSKPPSYKEIVCAMQWYLKQGSVGKLREDIEAGREPEEWRQVRIAYFCLYLSFTS